jgi:hypothetical protein
MVTSSTQIGCEKGVEVPAGIKRVLMDPQTGLVTRGRGRGQPVERRAGRRCVRLGIRHGEAVVYDPRRWTLVEDEYHDRVAVADRPVGTIPVYAGWLLPR